MLVETRPPDNPAPVVSVIVLNYNGALWIERCLASLRSQTIFREIEVLVADNNSPDGSAELARQSMSDWTNGSVLQFTTNFGYCEANNRAALAARGKYLLFLNNDTWLEPDCLEKLVQEVERVQASAATPLVLNYQDNSFQSIGAKGFDVFGLSTCRDPLKQTGDVLMPEGCSFLVRRDVFDLVGGFDPEFFMYADELDLSWRIWIAGHRAVGVPAARLHHRGAANVNPTGAQAMTEFRTSDTKRYFSNRNGLLVLLKNAQGLLLFLVPLQTGMLLLEAVVGWFMVRRWAFIRKAYIEAIKDCWRMRQHVRKERSRLNRIRARSDWWMLRFLRLRPNRFDELKRIREMGIPKVTGS